VESDECAWVGITCAFNTSTVTKVIWSESMLMGNIPADVGLLSSLTVFDLADNMIAGSIPSSLYSLTDLKDLFLHNNRLTGTLWSDGINNLQALVNVYLGDKLLTGPFPQGFAAESRARSRPLRKYLQHSSPLFLHACYDRLLVVVQ